jgi:hypothetical protein
MGSDVFAISKTCPICKKLVTMEFETDALGMKGNLYVPNDEVRQNDLDIFIGEIGNAKANCTDCGSNLVGKISIQEWKFVDVRFIRENGWKKKM